MRRALWLLLTWALPAAAQTPVLRIETGMHVARSTDAATDAAGKVLVTTSDDKTARVWSLPDLRPLGVLRPQIGEGNEGMIFTVAVSPDGSRAALGGWFDSGADSSVFVFDLATRQIVGRLRGLPQVAVSLAFSADGSRLAAGLGGANGIRIWDTRAWDRPPVSDAAYGDDVYGLAFAGDGRLATASLDGGLRLYDQQGRRADRQDVASGQQPYHVAFTPDGTRLAVGFVNALRVELRDGHTLVLRSTPDVSGLKGWNMSRVAWTLRGELVAAGAAFYNGSPAVFGWSNGGTGKRRILDEGFGNLTFAIRPLRGGGMVLMSGDDKLRVLDAAGQRAARRERLAQDLAKGVDRSDATRQLMLSRDGGQVAWMPWNARGRWLRFDVASLRLNHLAESPGGLTGWTDQAGTVRAEDWQNSTAPKLNGRPLSLDAHELSRSVSAATGGLLLGTTWNLRLFDATGRQRWAKPVPGNTWRINQSPDERLAVAAYEDGSIRWHRRSDGQELLALFVTADTQDWVAWTPSGYYAATPKGEALIGWHVNRGLDKAADFFPVGQFRDRFYRPDVVQKVLATLDEAAALRQVDAELGSATRPTTPILDDLPPVVTILSPHDDAQAPGPDQVIVYSVRSPSNKLIRNLRVIIDGRPVQPTRGAGRLPEPASASAEPRAELTVPIPPGQIVTLELIAETDTRASEPARIRLRGAPVPAVAAKPRAALYALVVGVGEYRDSRIRLRFAGKDARDLGTLLKRQGGRLYRDVQVRVLDDERATREAVLTGLDWLAKETTSGDVGMLFLAGHGVNDPTGRFWFLPVDVDVNRLRATAVSGTDIKEALAIPPGRMLAFVDACHAGNVLGTGRRSTADMDRLSNELSAAETGLIVFASSTGSEYSVELPEMGNGAFTAALLEGLRGLADTERKGAVTVSELDFYIVQRVKKLTGGDQHPNMLRHSSIRDFPLMATSP